jgi:ribonuclease VapC
VIVLDSSAILALLHEEPGANKVASIMASSAPRALQLGAANLAEIVGKSVDAGVASAVVLRLLKDAGVSVEPVTAEDGRIAGSMRAIPGGKQLSLGDRCCLALAIRSDAEVWTADRAWADLDLPVRVQLIR